MDQECSIRPVGNRRMFESRREREFYRYASCVDGVGLSQPGGLAVSSRDVTLTAFAQLVALRLNSRRCIVSLFDHKYQYLIAEATRTLSLQSDNIHDPNDALLWGATVFEREIGFCKLTLAQLSREANVQANSTVVIPDASADPRFIDHPLVTGHPFLRFYAGTALVTPGGYAIGTLAIIDDVPRVSGLAPDEKIFLQDVAVTIMNHLETTRLKNAHARGSRMVQGLSLFTEGKDGSGSNVDQENTDEHNRYHPTAGFSDLPKSQPQRDPKRPHNRNARDSNDTAVTSQARSNHTKDMASNSHNGRNRPSPHHHAVSKDLQKSLISTDVQEMFDRAANIVRGAMGVSGALFLDASIAQFGGLRTSGDSRKIWSEESDGIDASDNQVEEQEHVDRRSHKTDAPCAVLGFSHEDHVGPSLNMPERMLKSLLHRYPQGKIWTFDDTGLVSSDEFSDSSPVTPESSRTLPNCPRDAPPPHDADIKLKRQRDIRGSESSMIKDLFPGVRSIAIMPMWDSHRNRFFAGAVVWTYDPLRVLTFQDDINYLNAFCDVIMAENSRLDAQADGRAKTTFIRSVSHELRSPLHGILGSVECLLDRETSHFPDEMLQTIDTCGKSLLDIIDHLLIFSQVQSAKQISPWENTKQDREFRRPPRKDRNQGIETTSSEALIDLAALTEEICETVLYSTPKATAHFKSGSSSTSPSSHPLQVILEIDSSNLGTNGWAFKIHPGAWRRIILNLTTNSIKYTDEGYLKVKLSIRRALPDERRPDTDVVELSFADSGRGMSPEYLNNGLWKPFSQEDTLAEGTGLGLSIVQAIVKDNGGKIEIRSSKGVGTTICVALPLSRITPSETELGDLANPLNKAHFQGSTYRIVGCPGSEQRDGRTAQADLMLRNAIEKTFSDAGMHAHEASGIESPGAANIVVMTEAEVVHLNNRGLIPSAQVSEDGRRCLVLCHSVASARVLADAGISWLERSSFVSQPLGPRKLHKFLNENLIPGTGVGHSLALSEAARSEKKRKSRSILVEDLPSRRPSDLALSALSIKSSNNGESSESVMTDSDTSTASSSSSIKKIRRTSTPGNTGTEVTHQPSPTCTVLLVDDNEVNLRLLRAYMRRAGHGHLSATNGLEALQTYQSTTKAQENSVTPNSQTGHPSTAAPSIILMDITMPIMDGLEATRNIRAHERALGIKPALIVALTALAGPEARQEAYSSGVDSFLTKPVRFQQLMEVLSYFDVALSG